MLIGYARVAMEEQNHGTTYLKDGAIYLQQGMTYLYESCETDLDYVGCLTKTNFLVQFSLLRFSWFCGLQVSSLTYRTVLHLVLWHSVDG